MRLLSNAIKKEHQRIVAMIALYENQLVDLPKGVMAIKKVKNNEYHYLQYRDGKKVVSKYIGNDEKRIDEIKNQIEQRKHIEAMLDMLNAELKQVNKLMGELQ